MEKICKKCNKKMMIAQEGHPPYTGGYWTIYGCPNCGTLEFSYDDTYSNLDSNQIDLGDNPIQWHHDPYNLRLYAVSN